MGSGPRASEQREIVAQSALDAGTQPPAITSESRILAWPLWNQESGVVLLANFTGEPAGEATVRFAGPVRVESLRSLRGGLKFERAENGQITCQLPVETVTDILVLRAPAVEEGQAARAP
jgi:hypothetical protein